MLHNSECARLVPVMQWQPLGIVPSMLLGIGSTERKCCDGWWFIPLYAQTAQYLGRGLGCNTTTGKKHFGSSLSGHIYTELFQLYP